MPAQKQSARPRNDVAVHRWMNVLDVVALHPDAGDVLSAYGLHCVGCAFSEADTLEDGAYAHGLTDDDISNIIDDLTNLLQGIGMKRPSRLKIQKNAALELRRILSDEGKEYGVLLVGMDAQGNFSMEWAQDSGGHRTFSHREVPDVIIAASSTTLERIGGSSIDFREGRFTLDETPPSCCVTKTPRKKRRRSKARKAS